MKPKKPESTPHEQGMGTKITDANSRLHLIQPDFGFPYESPLISNIEDKLNRILLFLESETPAALIDKTGGNHITDFAGINCNTHFEPGGFRLISYEWGILYAAMLRAADVLKNKKFEEYTISRLNLIAGICPWFKILEEKNHGYISPVHSVISPSSLDDAGTMATALVKAGKAQENSAYTPLIENYTDYICNRQFRLPDGTFARNRPYKETLWIDDLFMSVSLLSQLGAATGQTAYFDDAVKQVVQFSDRMFDHRAGLFAHGWGKDAPHRPRFHWGRANGWALMAMTELLDALPAAHTGRKAVLDLFIAHLGGIARLQSKSGLWHQLLDRNDSYTESSASAIFIYCIAKAINRGLVSAADYGPMAVLAWNALAGRINGKGQIEGICVGTGMGFEPMFYYHRPVNIYAAHGYGPAILAATEIIGLVQGHSIENYDGALVFDYKKLE
jgi:rhamnogalacturonyl hydrolase YesR